MFPGGSLLGIWCRLNVAQYLWILCMFGVVGILASTFYLPKLSAKSPDIWRPSIDRANVS